MRERGLHHLLGRVMKRVAAHGHERRSDRESTRLVVLEAVPEK